MSDHTQTPRLVIFAVVVVAHVLLVVFWPAARTTHTLRANNNRTELVLVATRPAAIPPVEPVQPRKFGAARRSIESPDRLERPRATLEEPAVNPPAGAIDWARAAQLAIAEQLRTNDEARRRQQGFSSRRDGVPDQSGESAPKPEFGWAQWRIHRVQTLEEGGVLVRLNEHCALVISVLLIPVCKVGKIEARGDLFAHMDDPPASGDWKK